jgi:Uncharacterized protein conserved in bacteria (DUF2252)
MQAFAKLTHMVDGERRIIADPPLIIPIEDLLPAGRERDEVEGEIRGIIRAYRSTLQTDRRHLLENFDYVHLARKLVGVGSVGTRAWILLMLGRDDEDPLFLQAKEAQESVLEGFVGKSRYVNHGQRVVAGQRLMQAASEIFLGWTRVTGLDEQSRDFYLRQLRDWKGSADVDTMSPSVMTIYGASARQPSPAPTPARATGLPSRPTWATAMSSTGPSPISPVPTPTRTSVTTKPLSKPWTLAGLRHRPVSSRGKSKPLLAGPLRQRLTHEGSRDVGVPLRG